jgi:hypothetical protein
MAKVALIEGNLRIVALDLDAGARTRLHQDRVREVNAGVKHDELVIPVRTAAFDLQVEVELGGRTEPDDWPGPIHEQFLMPRGCDLG